MTIKKMSKGDLTKQRILLVAQELFYKHGFDSTSTASIAKKANISEAAMYKYFKSKSKLLIAAVEPTIKQSRLAKDYEPLSNDQLVDLWTADLLDNILVNRPQFTILFTEAVRHPEISEQYVEQVYQRTNGDNELLKRMEDGRLKKQDVMFFQIGIIGAILAMIQHLHIHQQLTTFTEMPMAIQLFATTAVKGYLLA
ncbi:TetR/AcrR family transcriptional regulator [Kurthia sibirica]|uniref:TetR/AcrR family transcriptional regulator n=1 Tax=Kurthia sibirica TaxID=202750 RepID=A0A2U3AK65_9BACL|nr:TetR/AcrR family transcriptional regulator [Kurthia sibirica]PWI24913.1 TetR/AcrR family transcriptional regulator [Kurthia sibirica]GEK33177.1 hypothetical protein KSI01_07100 [Kurthia sibirica]